MPVTVVDQEVATSTQYETGRKVFRNPRGQRYYYALLYYKVGVTYEIRIYKSSDGVTWTYDVANLVGTLPGNIYDGSALCFADDGSQTVIHVVWTIAGGSLYYRRGVIADAATNITWDAAYTLKAGIANNRWHRPSIARDPAGYIYITFRREGMLSELSYYYCDGRNIVGGRNGWTKVGAEPYLDAIDANAVYTSVKNDTIGDFTFVDPLSAGTTREIELYCKGDGNDYVEVYVYNGSVWAAAPNITPGAGWGWRSTDVSGILNTVVKLTNAQIYLVKKTSGKVGLVEVDCARIKISSPGLVVGYSLRVIASTVTDNPTVAQWSGEETLVDAGPTGASTAKAHAEVVAFASGGAEDVFIAGHFYDPTRIVYFAGGWEYSWDGATFTRGVAQLCHLVVGDSPLSVAIDPDSNIAYAAIYNSPNFEIWVRRWQIGTGWMAIGYNRIWLCGIRTFSIMIDTDATPNEVYVFLVSAIPCFGFGGQSIITFRRRTVTNWETANWVYPPIDISDDAEALDWMSGYLKDDNGDKGVIYTTLTTAKVRFLQYPVPVVVAVAYGDGVNWVQSG